MERKGLEQFIVNRKGYTFSDFYDKYKLLDDMIERRIVLDYLIEHEVISENRELSFSRPTPDSRIFNVIPIDQEDLEVKYNANDIKYELM